MPATLNGFGTTYSKHLNRRARVATCAHCGHEARLESFDTHEAIALLFVPVVKLQALRVFDMCPQCTNHRHMPRAKWRVAVDEAVARVFADVKAGASRDVVLDAFAAACAVCDVEAFDRVVAHVVEVAGDDAVVLAVAGGAAFDFERMALAVSLLERSLVLDRSESTMEQLALVHTLSLEPHKALPHIEHIWREKRAARLALALLVVDAFQTLAEHEQAVRLLDRLAAAFPEAATAATWQQQRALSTKKDAAKRTVFRINLRRLASPEALKRVKLTGASTSPREKAIGAAIAATFVVALFGGSAFAEAHRDVWLVNGTDEAYTVDIAGGNVVVQPFRARKVEGVGVGHHELKVHLLSGATRVVAVDDDVNPLWAPVDLALSQHVLNPDGAAVLWVERTTYSAHPNPDAENGFDVDAPGVLHVLNSDYDFQPFPRQISVKGSGSVTKTRLDVAPNGAIALHLAGEHGVDVAEARFRWSADPAAAFFLVGQRADAATEALLREHLADKPTPLDLWFAWTELQAKLHPGAAVDFSILETNTDSCGAFLLASVRDHSRDLSTAQALSPVCPAVSAAAAIRAGVANDLDEAARLLASSGTPARSPSAHADYWRRAQLLVGHVDDVVAFEDARARDPIPGLITRLNDAYHRGDVVSAQSLVERLTKELGSKPVWLQRVIAYGTGDVAALTALPDAKPRTTLELAAISGALDDAVKGFDALSDEDAFVVVAGAVRHHRADVDDLVRRLVLRVPAAAVLQQATPPTLAALRTNVPAHSVQTGIVTVLSERRPSPELNAEAWRLAVGDETPSLFLATRPASITRNPRATP